ncbi:MAG TPA: hypothetical protein VF079_07825 [Sphingomicrobium sp.]
MAKQFTRLFLVAAFLTCSCTPSAPPRLHGLSQGEVSSFNSTADGCVLSLLFDDFTAPVKSKAAVPLRRFTIAASDAAAGHPVTFDIRGGMQNAAGSKIALKVGNQQLQLEPNAEEFGVQGKGTISAADTRVEVRLDVAPSATAQPADVLLAVDSIDVSLGGCSTHKQ